MHPAMLRTDSRLNILFLYVISCLSAYCAEVFPCFLMKNEVHLAHIAGQRADITSQLAHIAGQRTDIAVWRTCIAIERSNIASQRTNIAIQRGDIASQICKPDLDKYL